MPREYKHDIVNIRLCMFGVFSLRFTYSLLKSIIKGINMDSIIIIGGGQAAAFAATTLRKEGFEGKLSVISDEETVFYERPPLSKGILSGSEELETLPFFAQKDIEALNIQWHKPQRAKSINPKKKQVILDDQTVLSYDRLIIATGSRPRIPDPQWNSLENVYTLRTIKDALSLKKVMLPEKRLAIIGGGWIGLEVAATARKLNLKVDLFERGERLCARSVSEEVSRELLMLHQDNQTQIHLQCGDISLHENPDKSITLSSTTQKIIADIVLVGAGTEMAKELALEAGLTAQEGILVNHFGQTSDPNIYAAGDVAMHPLVGFCTQSWANAQQQAVIVAKHIMDKDPAPYTEIPWVWSDQYQHNIQVLGLPIDDNCQLIIREESPSQKTYIHIDQNNMVRSIVAINSPKSIGVGRMWFKRKKVLDPALLADTSIDIITLR